MAHSPWPWPLPLPLRRWSMILNALVERLTRRAKDDFQGLALRGGADPAGRLLVSALHAQLSRHAGALAHEATLFVEVPLRNGLEPQRASALEALYGGQQAEASR